jgi:hypothetical protein
MEIDLTNISDKLEYCQQIENILENITVHLEADPKALKEVLLLRNRVHAIVERLIKLYALHAPYRLNEWDNIISHLEENCEALEKRIIGK